MIRSVQRGFRFLGRYKKAVFLAYGANLMVGLLLALPVLRIIDESMGKGLLAQRMVDSIDYDWLQLFQERVSGAASTFSPAVLGLGPFLEHWEALLEGDLFSLPLEIVLIGVLYLLLNAFLSGAFLGSLSFDPRGTVTREYLRTGGEFFGRFLRMGLLALFLYFFLQAFFAIPLASLLDHLEGTTQTSRGAFYWRFTFYVFTFPLLLLSGILIDYAKIILAAEDRSSALLAFCSSCSFFVRNPAGLGGLYLVLSGIALAWLLFYAAVESLIPQSSAFGILGAVAVQQTYMAGRLAIRYWFYASQFSFYLERR